ncbi:type VII secretion target [Gordonia sp. 4N]|uniref:type VII secretion target n=2 Tax=Gordonia TaxID=2053 RepID=UPI000815EBEE|nr:type VII secretion target [Gordonia sp. 4N]SCB99654.1 Excreted virulence factor EspC, type VII ESX diderm [Gordonia sp. v-85]
MEPNRAAPRQKPMSPSSPHPHPAPTRPGPDPAGRLVADSSALHEFSGTHRTNARMLEGGTGSDDAAVVELAITFGLIGIEFLTAVVEFLDLYRRTIEAATAREERLGLTTSSAATSYADCDCAAADRIATAGELTL